MKKGKLLNFEVMILILKPEYVLVTGIGHFENGDRVKVKSCKINLHELCNDTKIHDIYDNINLFLLHNSTPYKYLKQNSIYYKTFIMTNLIKLNIYLGGYEGNEYERVSYKTRKRAKGCYTYQ